MADEKVQLKVFRVVAWKDATTVALLVASSGVERDD